ncbi:MAG: hypothetical protein IPK53_19565 [bacterium]|nr:hypothetical protein [bacterium]
MVKVRGRILQENDQVIGTIHTAPRASPNATAAEAQNKLYWETTVLQQGQPTASGSVSNFAHRLTKRIHNIVASRRRLLAADSFPDTTPADNNFFTGNFMYGQHDRIIDVVICPLFHPAGQRQPSKPRLGQVASCR